MLWLTRYAPLMAQAGAGRKTRDLPACTVLWQFERSGDWWNVETLDGVRGWIQSAYLEGYEETLPKDCVDIADIQTATQLDFEQYVIYNGVKQVNMCGELCVCYLRGMKLSELLEIWTVKQPSLFKRIFGAGRARGTGAAELSEILAVFDVPSKQLTAKTYTPKMLMQIAGNNIVSVNMDAVNGRLRGAGVLHWVVVTEVMPERTGYGFVSVYNPAPNRIERYSWNEFINSARVPYGIVMEG
jgi:hypothetical protein